MKQLLCISAFLLLAGAAQAQFLGLPVAESAGVKQPGATALSGGAVIGDNLNAWGARLSFAPFSRMTLFADAGLIDPSPGSLGPTAQGGVLFALPFSDSPVDVGARATMGYASFDIKHHDGKYDYTAKTVQIGGLVSRDFDFCSPYAFLGFARTGSTVKGAGNRRSKNSTDPALAAGLLLRFGQQFSLHGEISHVDDLFYSIGIRNVF